MYTNIIYFTYTITDIIIHFHINAIIKVDAAIMLMEALVSAALSYGCLHLNKYSTSLPLSSFS